MTPKHASGWWHNTTPERRLAQLDGGIELGMTSSQIALASGAAGTSVRRIASVCGRRLPRTGAKMQAARAKQWASTRARNAYMRGEPVDFFGTGEPADDFRLDETGA